MTTAHFDILTNVGRKRPVKVVLRLGATVHGQALFEDIESAEAYGRKWVASREKAASQIEPKPIRGLRDHVFDLASEHVSELLAQREGGAA